MATVQSTPKPNEAHTSKPGLRNKHVTDQDRTDLQTIDTALDALFEREIFNSRSPYILTIPQDPDAVYKHRSGFQAAQFAYHTPFARDEWENLQYQTYKYHDPGQSLYKQQVHDYSDKDKPAVQAPSAGPKKRMSLNAYKKAKTGISSPIYTPPDGGHKINKHMDPLEAAQRLSHHQLERIRDADRRSALEREAKRKREEHSAAAKADKDKTDSKAGDEAPPAKKGCWDTSSKSNGDHKSGPNNLPPKLSPLREPMSPLLPARLSPTIPYNIDAALREQRDAAEEKDNKLGSSPSSKPAPKKGFKAGSLSPGETPSKGKERSLVVKLKVGTGKSRQSKLDKHDKHEKHEKHNTESKGKQDTHSKSKHDSQPKVDSRSPKLTPSKAPTLSKKRSREEEPISSAKKLKATNGRPITPVQSEMLSPESIKATPSLLKEAHNTAMQRVQSSDGMPKTPAEVNTPQVNGHEPKTPSKSAAPKTTAQRAWEAERNKYDALGRSLKHASRDHSTAKPPADELAAVKAVESMICYMIAFTCSDEALASAEPKLPPSLSVWKGLTSWYHGIRHCCSKLPQLQGIASVLGLALASRVLKLLATSKSQDQTVYNEYINLMDSTSTEMNRRLHPGVIQEIFPASWAKSQNGSTTSKLDAQKLLTIQYQLPVGMHTSPLQAALAARAMLAEWLAKSEHDYKLQV